MKDPLVWNRMRSAALLLAVSAASWAAAACKRSDDPQRVQVTVTADGFVPDKKEVEIGRPVTLVVTRKVEPSCATEVVLKDFGIHKPLPKDQPVEVTFTPTKPGKIRMACAMDMVAGELIAE